MGFFSINKELKEENDKLKTELQEKSLLIEELKSKIPRSYLINNLMAISPQIKEMKEKAIELIKKKKSIINQRYYFKHKNKQKENQNYFNKEICLTKNPFMSKEQYEHYLNL